MAHVGEARAVGRTSPGTPAIARAFSVWDSGGTPLYARWRDVGPLEEIAYVDGQQVAADPYRPNAGAWTARFDALEERYAVRFRSLRSVVALQKLRASLPQRRPRSRMRPAARRQRRASARSRGRLGDGDSDPHIAPHRRLRRGGWW